MGDYEDVGTGGRPLLFVRKVYKVRSRGRHRRPAEIVQWFLCTANQKAPRPGFGVERRQWRMKRNGERAGTGRITNGSE